MQAIVITTIVILNLCISLAAQTPTSPSAQQGASTPRGTAAPSSVLLKGYVRLGDVPVTVYRAVSKTDRKTENTEEILANRITNVMVDDSGELKIGESSPGRHRFFIPIGTIAPGDLFTVRTGDGHTTYVKLEPTYFQKYVQPDEKLNEQPHQRETGHGFTGADILDATPANQFLFGVSEEIDNRVQNDFQEDLKNAPLDAIRNIIARRLKLMERVWQAIQAKEAMDQLRQRMEEPLPPGATWVDLGRYVGGAIMDGRDLKDAVGSFGRGVSSPTSSQPASGTPGVQPSATGGGRGTSKPPARANLQPAIPSAAASSRIQRPAQKPDFAKLRPHTTQNLGLTDHSKEFENSNDAGRIRIAEQIGEEGMEAYAEQQGFFPLLRPGSNAEGGDRSIRQGFDGAYWDAKTGEIVILETKGTGQRAQLNDLLTTTVRGRNQEGTVRWAIEAAGRYLAWNTGDAEKRRARNFLTALSENDAPIRVETVVTEHNNGKPGATHVYLTDWHP